MYYLIGDVRNEKYLFVMTKHTPPRYIKLEGIFEDPTQVLDIVLVKMMNASRPQGAAFNLDLSRMNDLF